jgi:hypothetical protein
LGIACGALDVYENVLRTKLTDVPPFTRRGDQALYQHLLGRATGLVDLAEAGLFEAADRYLSQAKRAAEAGRPVDENSGLPAQADRRHTAPWATRCSR